MCFLLSFQPFLEFFYNLRSVVLLIHLVPSIVFHQLPGDRWLSVNSWHGLLLQWYSSNVPAGLNFDWKDCFKFLHKLLGWVKQTTPLQAPWAWAGRQAGYPSALHLANLGRCVHWQRSTSELETPGRAVCSLFSLCACVRFMSPHDLLSFSFRPLKALFW